jgi:hypothetical protein
VLFPPVAQTFSLVPNEQRLRCADKSVCGLGSNGPMARGDQPSALPTGPPNAAMRCGQAVRFYGCELTFPTNAWVVRKDFAVCPRSSSRGLTR